MRIAALIRAIGAAPGPLRAGFACVVLGALGLIASLAIAPPPLPWAQAAGGGFGAATPLLPPLMPFLAALLGLLAGAVCLSAAAKGHAASRLATGAPPPAATDPVASLVLGLQEAVRDIRGVLADERGELAALREVCGTATHDAMMVGARLAGVALDAETRLAAGVTQAEQALREPGAAATRAAEAAARVERALPELAELVRRGAAQTLHAASPPVSDKSASVVSGPSGEAARFVAVADGVVQTFGAMIADAVGQMAALSDVVAVLRRDALALDMAGREIATASAGVVARLGEAVTHADATLAQLPTAATAVTAAASAAASAITGVAGEAAMAVTAAAGEAAAGLRHEAAVLRAAGQESAAAGHLAVAHLMRIAQTAIAPAAVVPRDTAADIGALAAVVTTLRDVAETLVTRTRGLEATGEAAMAQISAEAARAVAVLGGLPDATAEMAVVLSELRQEAAVLTQAAHHVRAAGDHAAEAVSGAATRAELSVTALETAGIRLATAGDEAAARVAATVARAEQEASPLPAIAARFADIVERLAAIAAALPGEDALGQEKLTASRLEAAAARLDGLDALGLRLENTAAGLPAALDDLAIRAGAFQAEALRIGAEVAAQAAAEAGADDEPDIGLAPALEILAGLSSEIGLAVHRLESALAHHDGTGQTLAASIARVRDAVEAVAQAQAVPGQSGAAHAPPCRLQTGEQRVPAPY